MLIQVSIYESISAGNVFYGCFEKQLTTKWPICYTENKGSKDQMAWFTSQLQMQDVWTGFRPFLQRTERFPWKDSKSAWFF